MFYKPQTYCTSRMGSPPPPLLSPNYLSSDRFCPQNLPPGPPTGTCSHTHKDTHDTKDSRRGVGVATYHRNLYVS